MAAKFATTLQPGQKAGNTSETVEKEGEQGSTQGGGPMAFRLRHTINAVYVVVATNVNFSVRLGVAFLHAR